MEAPVAEVQGAKGHGVQASKGQRGPLLSLRQTRALRKCQGWAVPGGLVPAEAPGG